MLGILGVSRSDYYYYMNHEMTRTEERRMKITDRIVKIFNESGQLYGSPKIAAIINRDGGNNGNINFPKMGNLKFPNLGGIIFLFL